MTQEHAMNWLRQVGGQLYRSPHAGAGPTAWVAVVRTPAGPIGRGKLIVALGATLQEAAMAAENQWQKLWQDKHGAH
jgi:hypothetical protein